MKLQIVTWRDAYFDTDMPDKPRKDYLVQTAGWVKRRGKFLVVYSEKLPDKEGWRAITHIPIENVVRRRTLKEEE